MNPIPGYAAGMSDSSFLGYVAWYTITQPRVTHLELREMVADLPLSKSVLPKAPRMGDAFKRACRYSERKKVAIQGSDTFANFLIRNVAQDSTQVERHLVLEVVDEEGKRLDYHVVAQLTFDRTNDTLRVRQLRTDTALQALTDETLKMFTDNFDKASKYLDAQVLRLMIRQHLDVMSATSVRQQGSVYFIPIAAKKQTEALETLCQRLGKGSAFHSLPLVDTTKQREMIKDAFENDVHEQATQLIAEMTLKRQKGSTITAAKFTTYRNQFAKLKKDIGEYATIVDSELEKAKLEIQSLDSNLQKFLTQGLIK